VVAEEDNNMAKFDAYFALAKAKGIDVLELYFSRGKSTSFKLYNSQIEGYKIAEDISLYARGIVNGKIGYASTEKITKDTPAFLIQEILTNAGTVTKEELAIIFEGSEKYKKRNVFNPAIAELPIETKKERLFALEKKLKALDNRVTQVNACTYNERESEAMLINSYGLKLKRKSNYYYYYAGVLAEASGERKSSGEVHLSNDPADFDLDAFAKKIVEKAVEKFGGTQCKSKNYKVVLDKDVVADLLEAYLENASAEEVQKKTSLMLGKLQQPVASKKVTVMEMPLTKNQFFTYFDDEGVATYNKTVIKKGVLQTYFYNLTTAKKDGVTTTGNGYRGGGKVGVGFNNIVLKPGKKSLQQLFGQVKEGVYITELMGVHAGLNPQSGNFSLQANGFMIEKGQKATPLTLITVAGNLVDVFMNVKEVANDNELLLSSYNVPSVFIKSLTVSGK
jgi:PmbA protein